MSPEEVHARALNQAGRGQKAQAISKTRETESAFKIARPLVERDVHDLCPVKPSPHESKFEVTYCIQHNANTASAC